ncbi:hypothetical protein EC991_004479 [Linnemannia zychae]|nr:hypothetical protein EC991_004479 [Linnemannia zychae]
MPPRFVAPAAPKCPRCTKSVYSAEQIIGPNGAPWHKACFTCRECNRRLDSNILGEHEGEAYCKTCHKKMWGPTGYGYASGLLVREDPESQFKQSIGRPPNSAGSQTSNDNNTTSFATLDEVVYNNTGGSNRSASRDYNDIGSSNDNAKEETEEQRRERLTPVNATLKKRNSLDEIREQAEASRRAYDEAHNQRIASKYGKVTADSTGGSTASAGSRSDLHFGGGSSSHLHAQSGYISAGSDTSSAFGSTKATTSSPAPSFSSISSTTSSQPATKSLFLNQSYRTNSSVSTTSYQDAESDYAKSRQALNFQTGAPTATAPVSSGPPSLPKRAPEPAREPTPTQQYRQDEQSTAVDDDVQDYMPIRVVARKEEPTPAPAPAPSAVEEDEWDAPSAQQKQPEQPIYRSQYLKQQEQREREQREQAQREQEFLSRGRTSSNAPVGSSSSSSAPYSAASTPITSARLNSLINETDKLTLKEQEQRHTQPAADMDEWDEEPTPTMPSKPQHLSYSPARNVSSATTRTWTPTAINPSEPTAQEYQQQQSTSTNHSRIPSAELNSNKNVSPSSPMTSQATSTPKTSYYRSSGLMTPKKMTASFGGGGDICPRCQKTVYHAESALAPGGAKYHKLCLRCVECSKSLDSTNMTDRQGTPYCKACYSKAWGAKGYGYGSGASMLHTEL